MFLTIAYKTGWIHFKTVGNHTEITYQTADYTVRAARTEIGAKRAITGSQ